MTTISGTNITTSQALALGGSATIILGSLLPWVTARSIFGQMSVNGIEGDGQLTLVLGVALLLGAILRFGSTRWRNVLMGGAAAAFLIASVTAANAESRVDDELIHASAGPGVYLVMLGAGLIVVGGVLHPRQKQQPAVDNQQPPVDQPHRDS